MFARAFNEGEASLYRTGTYDAGRRAIAEQRRGAAISGVDDLRVRVRGDEQRVVEAQRLQQAADDREAVDEAGAAEPDVEAGGLPGKAEAILDERRGVRQAVVRVLGADDQHLDVLAP